MIRTITGVLLAGLLGAGLPAVLHFTQLARENAFNRFETPPNLVPLAVIVCGFGIATYRVTALWMLLTAAAALAISAVALVLTLPEIARSPVPYVGWSLGVGAIAAWTWTAVRDSRRSPR